MADQNNNQEGQVEDEGAAGQEGAAGAEGQATQVNYLDMSDEELLKAGPPSFEPAGAAAAAGSTDAKPEGAGSEGEGAGEGQGDEGGEGQEGAGDAAGDETGGKPGEKQGSEPADKGKEATEPEGKKEGEQDKPAVIDYEAEFKKLTAPFKANGRDIKVESVDDAIALMQMGANYNKKMAALKPNLKLMKLLENNGLLSEEKIGFLIDLGKKDPGAINKLVKDSGLDPMDLSAELASGYKPTTRNVDDREMELDTVMEDLQDSPAYTRTLGIVGTKWDAASKRTISEAPQLMKVINDHVERGIYDLIATEVEKERMFGRLTGLSDLEAYHRVGDAINARGGFNHLEPAKVQPATEAKPAAVVVTPPARVEDDKLKDKRRAASSTKPVAPASTPKDFNPLALSDEEFNKLVKTKLL